MVSTRIISLGSLTMCLFLALISFTLAQTDETLVDPVEEAPATTPAERPVDRETAITERRETIEANQAERVEALEAAQAERVENREELQVERQETREAAQTERRATLEVRAQERITNLAANLSNRLDAVIARLDNIIARFDSRIEKLAATGIDTISAQAALDRARTSVAAAEATIATIDSEVAGAIGSTDPRAAWQQVKVIFTETRDLIRIAHTDLRTALVELKAAVEAGPIDQTTPEELSN